jgi:hypothetical protein
MVNLRIARLNKHESYIGENGNVHTRNFVGMSEGK